jgi:OOP family OmpA-OmpF porin
MKKTIKIAALISLALASVAASAQTDGYVVDGRNVVARSGTNLCWHTGYWTPAMAIAECDPDLVKKEMPKAAPVPMAAPAAPAPAAAPVAAKPITLKADALFAFDKAILTDAGKANIDQEIAAKASGLAKIDLILVTGHTDRLGSHQYNQQLSEKRAAAVKGYMVSKGFDANAIETMGAGKTQPVPGVKCEDKLPRAKLIECLAPHRRVHVEVKGMPK